MRRAVKSISSFPDSKFFSVISEGLNHIAENIQKLSDSAEILGSSNQSRASHVLNFIAAEEAAKYLVLIDAVRCPRKPQDLRKKQLSRFYNHLAKGIYAEVCEMRPATFKELIGYIDLLRAEYYLDGSNNHYWIIKNDIILSREQALYVDYIEVNDEFMWWGPWIIDDDSSLPRWHHTSAAIKLVRSMHTVGLSKKEALSHIARVWRPTQWNMSNTYSDLDSVIRRTFDVLQENGLLKGDNHRLELIRRSWSFPLYEVDLGCIEVTVADLEHKRRRLMGLCQED